MIDRPAHLDSCTVKAKTGCGNLYVHVSFLDNQPFEVFINMGAQGNCLSSKNGALGTTISIALRQNQDRRASVLEEIASHLVGTRCSRPCQGANGDIESLSCEDAIGKVLLNLLVTTDRARKPKVVVPLAPGATTEVPPPTIIETIKDAVQPPSPILSFGPCPVCRIGMMVTQPKQPCPTCDNPKCHYKECS